MKKLFTILFIFLVLRAGAQDITQHPTSNIQNNPDTCISKEDYNRNQALYLSVCNILQYVTDDGKITNKKAFAAAVKFYLEYYNSTFIIQNSK